MLRTMLELEIHRATVSSAEALPGSGLLRGDSESRETPVGDSAASRR